MSNYALSMEALNARDTLHAKWAVAAAAITGGMGMGIWYAPIPSAIAIGAALALGSQIWRAEALTARDAAEMTRLRAWSLDPNELPNELSDPQVTEKRVFVGQGFAIDADWLQRWDIVCQSPAPVPKHGEKTEDGDPRIYGLGYQRVESIFLRDRTLSQHIGIFGSTGCGKTRCMEGIIASYIRFAPGSTIVIVDPKGDRDLKDNFYSIATEAGREFEYVSLAYPKRRDGSGSASYNPFARYRAGDPNDLQSKIAAMIPTSKGNEYFTTSARNAAAKVVSTCHYIRGFLAAVGGRGGCLAPVHVVAARAKKIAGKQPLTVAHIEQAWAEVRNADLRDIDPLNARAFSMTPSGWVARISKFYDYAVMRPRVPLAHIRRLLWPITWSGGDQDPELLEEQERAAYEAAAAQWQEGDPEIRQSQFQPNILQRFIAVPHPLDDGYKPQKPEDALDVALWKPLLESAQIARIRDALVDLRGPIVADFQTQAALELDKRANANSSLLAAVGSFAGTESVVDAAEPDVDLSRSIANKRIVYFEADVLSKPNLAAAFCKAVIADLASIAAEINTSSIPQDQRHPIILVVDELNSVCTHDLGLLLTMSRSSGVRVVAIGQDRAGLAVAIGDKESKQFLNQLNTVFQMRVKERSEAEDAAKSARDFKIATQSHNVSITPAMGDSGNKNIGIFSANEGTNLSNERQSGIPADALMTLPFGQAFLVTNGPTYLVSVPQVAVPPDRRRSLVDDRCPPRPPETSEQPVPRDDGSEGL